MTARTRFFRRDPGFGGVSVAVRLLGAIALATAQACTSGGGGSNGNPTISLSLTPGSGSVIQGTSIQFNAVATGSSDFTGSVSFSVSGAPSGVTVSVGTVQQSGAVFTAVVTVTAANSATTGGATLTVNASGGAGITSSKTFALTVTSSVGGSGSFTLAASPATVSLAQGANTQVTITITRTGGFTGSVSFTVTGEPAGLTATFNPISTTGNSTTLTLAANATLSAGSYPLTITGAGAATPTQQSVQVTPTITPSGSSIQYVLDFTGCGATAPLWVASQDGSGPWAPVVGVNNVYTFTITGNKAGWAFTENLGGVFSTVVNWFTRADIPPGPATSLCPVRKSNSVTIAGVSATDYVALSLGDGQSEWFSGLLQTVTINNIFTGTHDLVAYRGNATPQRPAATDRAFILRDLNVASGGSVGTIDFNGASAIVPIPATMSVANSQAGDQLQYSLQYATGGTAACTGGVLSSISAGTPSEVMYGIPAASQRATDFHQLQVFATSSPQTENRVVTQSFHAYADHTVTLGPMLPTPTMTDLNLAAYRRIQAVGTIPTEYPTGVTLQYINNASLRTVSLQASLNWVGSTTATLAMPDFTSVPGWNSSWAPPAGQAVNWTMFATRIDDYLTGKLVPDCVEGSLFMAGYKKGTM